MRLSCFLVALLALGAGCHGQPGPPDRPPVPDSTTYAAPAYRATLRSFGQRRAQLARRYQRARTAAGRATCLAAARALLLTSLDSTIFPAWEGTRWAFYGQSWQPRQGSIACGYFVTTALHDAGLRLPRTLLAKQTSERIILNLTREPFIWRYRGLSRAEFVRQVRELGPGLYVLGLDFHAGFLRVREDGSVQLVHSSYLGPAAVVREAAGSSPALASRYRVVGKVSADPMFLRQWLLREALPARGCTVRK